MKGEIVAVLALSLLLAGCAEKAPPGGPVTLLTSAMPFDADECDPAGAQAVLLSDPQHGTALAAANDGAGIPVMWPPGYTGRRVGSQVVVVDPSGRAVATTGQSYRMSGNVLIQAPVGGWPNREDRRYRRGWVDSPIGLDMFYACGPASPSSTQTPPPII